MHPNVRTGYRNVSKCRLIILMHPEISRPSPHGGMIILHHDAHGTLSYIMIRRNVFAKIYGQSGIVMYPLLHTGFTPLLITFIYLPGSRASLLELADLHSK